MRRVMLRIAAQNPRLKHGCRAVMVQESRSWSLVWLVIRPNDFLDRNGCRRFHLSSGGELNADAANDAIWAHSTLMIMPCLDDALVRGSWALTFVLRLSFNHGGCCLVACPGLTPSSLLLAGQIDCVALCWKPGQKLPEHALVYTRYLLLWSSFISGLLLWHWDPLPKNPAQTANAPLFAADLLLLPFRTPRRNNVVFASLGLGRFPCHFFGLGRVNYPGWLVNRRCSFGVHLWLSCFWASKDTKGFRMCLVDQLHPESFLLFLFWEIGTHGILYYVLGDKASFLAMQSFWSKHHDLIALFFNSY